MQIIEHLWKTPKKKKQNHSHIQFQWYDTENEYLYIWMHMFDSTLMLDDGFCVFLYITAINCNDIWGIHRT